MDEVRGIVIGDSGTSWQLFYNSRPQNQKQYASNDDAAIEDARAKIQALVAENGGFPCYLYQGSEWEIRLYR